MVHMILQKAGIIKLSRLMRILQDGCQVAKCETPDLQSVADCLQQRAYCLEAGQLYIARPEVMFDQNQRLKSIWQYLIQKLLKLSQVSLK